MRSMRAQMCLMSTCTHPIPLTQHGQLLLPQHSPSDAALSSLPVDKCTGTQRKLSHVSQQYKEQRARLPGPCACGGAEAAGGGGG